MAVWRYGQSAPPCRNSGGGFGALALVWSLLALPETLPAAARKARPREQVLKAYWS